MEIRGIDIRKLRLEDGTHVEDESQIYQWGLGGIRLAQASGRSESDIEDAILLVLAVVAHAVVVDRTRCNLGRFFRRGKLSFEETDRLMGSSIRADSAGLFGGPPGEN